MRPLRLGLALSLTASLSILVAAGVACSASGEGTSAADYDAGSRDRGAVGDGGSNPLDDAAPTSPDGSSTTDAAGEDADTTARGEIVVSGQMSPRGVAVDATSVYWANNGGSAAEKQILKASLSPGATATPLTSNLANPIVFAQDATHVYFIDLLPADGAVKRVAKTGGAAETLAPAASAITLALFGTNVYFGTTDGNVRRVPKTGGTVSDVVTGEGFMHGLAVDAQYVWFTTGITSGGPSPIPVTTAYALKRAPIGGGSAATAVYTPSFSGGELAGVVVTPAGVVFANAYENRIYALPPDGGAVVRLSGATSPSHVATEGNGVYWINKLGDQHASIGSVPLDKSNIGSTIAFEQPGAYGIAVDATHVYWANRVEGTIRRVAR